MVRKLIQLLVSEPFLAGFSKRNRNRLVQPIPLGVKVRVPGLSIETAQEAVTIAPKCAHS